MKSIKNFYKISTLVASLALAALAFFIPAPSGQTQTAGASLSLAPSSGSYTVGSTFAVQIRVNTAGTSTTAVSAFLSFDSSRLQVTSIDTSLSAYDIQAQQEVVGNEIRIVRGKAAPGVNSSNALLAYVNFRAIANGTAPVTLNLTARGQGPSRIIVIGGQGTDILNSVSNASFTISGSSPTPTPTPTRTPTPTPTPTRTPTPTPTPSPTPTPTPPPVGGASEHLVPSSGSYQVGREFPVEIRVNTDNRNVVAVSAHFYYDTQVLEAIAIDSSGSAFDIRAEELISGGQIRISRGKATPGVNSSNAYLAKINFRARAAGTANVNFNLTAAGQGPTRVVVDDGRGTDILGSVMSGSYTITAGTPSPSPSPSPTPSPTATPIPEPTRSPPPLPELAVVLHARPKAGIAPLDNVSLTGNVFGTTQGSIEWQFDCTDDGTYEHTVTNNLTEYAVADLCDYPEAGKYTAAVKVKRGGVVAEDTVKINLASPEGFPDGTLIKLPDDPRVYVISDGARRWIQSPRVFQENSYSWEEVKEIVNSVLDSIQPGPDMTFSISELRGKANLLRTKTADHVYVLIDGKLHWIPSPIVFNVYELNWQDVKTVSENQLKKYPHTSLLKEPDDPKVYYINRIGQKKWISNPEVFASYNNKWSNVIEVAPEELAIYPEVNLIREEGGTKVYLIQKNVKRWIKTAHTFLQLGYKWEDISPVNRADLGAYIEGPSIE